MRCRYLPSATFSKANLLAAALVVLLPTCVISSYDGQAPTRKLTVMSPTFSAGELMPETYACTGNGISPPIGWSGVPDGTRTIAVMMARQDGPPDTVGIPNDGVHWLVYNIPADRSSLPEGYRMQVPDDGSERAVNDFGVKGYDGPCPPKGELSRYSFHVFAVGKRLDLADRAGVSEVLTEMDGTVLAHGQMGAVFGYETY